MLKENRILKKILNIFCLCIILVSSFIISSESIFAATIPSYDLEKTFPGERRDYEQVFQPADVAFDGSGNKYVADVGHHAIIKYDSAGQYVTHWSLFNPISIAVDLSTNQIYVGLVNNEVHIFDDRGNAL